MAGLSARVREIGLSEVYRCTETPVVDIVFVHGLNGHAYNTWASKNNGTFWPADLLPQVLGPSRVRILTYGYNANVTAFTDGASKDRLHNHAETLASGLAANRNLRGCPDRPIIFVCHSLGGLVVKRAMIHCRSVDNEKIQHIRSIYISTYGILFLGTPHNGSDVAKWGALLQNICSVVMPKKFMESSPHLVKALKTNNETLQNINSLFADMTSRFHLYFFHETLSSDIKGTRELIVDESSAAPYMEGVERMGIEADHSHMCKFDDDGSPGYEAVAEALLRYSRDAPTTIRERWIEEDRGRRLKKETIAREMFGNVDTEQLGRSAPDLRSIGRPHMLPGHQSPVTLNQYEVEEPADPSFPYSNAELMVLPSERRRSVVSEMAMAESTELPLARSLRADPLFVVPPGFHPNATFVGMKKELDVLHSRLYKAKKRTERLTAVLICGGPGSGKSHLARQYVCTHRDIYPAGVFWVDAKSLESTYKCFWDMAQAAALTDGQEFHYPDTNPSHRYVDSLRGWLQNREGWLIVFDGISFAHEHDINNFKQFLPFNKNCSIIYTSVDKTLKRKQRLYEPYCLQVKPLEPEDACKLLFDDLGIKRPTAGQIRKATELVTHYECLPLAIHAISHRLSAMSKPIERYHLNSHLTDEKLAEPFLSIMHDLFRLEHFAALNLINMLSFFSHHIPVGLLTSGLSALKSWHVEVLTSHRSGERGDLDTTIGILIRYGLVERASDSYALHPSALSPQAERDNVLEQKFVVPDLSESQTESSQEAFFSPFSQSAGTIDVLKIHSVVQGFCRDELKMMDEEKKSKSATGTNNPETGYHDSWLVVACNVFRTSYGKVRLDHMDDCGLVKDYREFETHASRLIENFPKRSAREPATLRKAREEMKAIKKSISQAIDRISPSAGSIRTQRSVFDRSSSSSSSVPESAAEDMPAWLGPETVSPTVESPQEVAPRSQRFNLKPFLPHIFRHSSHGQSGQTEDHGKDQENTDVTATAPSLSRTSEATERPKPRSSEGVSSANTPDDRGWHLVKKSSKVSKSIDKPKRPSFPHRIRGSQPAAPILKVFPVEGISASSKPQDTGRSSSRTSASEALTAVHHASSPPVDDSKRTQRPQMDGRQFVSAPGDFTKGMQKENDLPSYATIAARQAQNLSEKPRSASIPGRTRSRIPGLQDKSSEESLFNRPSNVLLSKAPLTSSTYSEPDPTYLSHQLNALELGMAASRYRAPPGASFSGITSPVGDMSASTPSMTYLSPGLPYEGNIEVSVARRLSTTPSTSTGPISHPSAFMPGTSPPVAEIHAGYTSEPAPEPMSRDMSAKSQQSWATDPVPYPHRYPPVSVVSPIAKLTSLARPSNFQTEPSYAAAAAQLRPFNPPEAQVPVFEPGWPRMNVEGGPQFGGAVQYTAAKQLMPGYPATFHPNLSGPLLPHGFTKPIVEPRGGRARSGSSPPRHECE
ncbi:LipA and NB-ARC domain protein [Aspergillus homomorphus CBS 101889]|uniref:Catalytic protein n=1 Tax=Aspergillus homomorphus (strain CBS 101889) TaxID=1450537 RepID=A0A395I5Y5_ASPHC|nr:catalytic protein [Aspergillus homomorphus CBS 101889]RAL15417.1 catalytic protein [Aspergillus homomorphus CBS 101889]